MGSLKIWKFETKEARNLKAEKPINQESPYPSKHRFPPLCEKAQHIGLIFLALADGHLSSASIHDFNVLTASSSSKFMIHVNLYECFEYLVTLMRKRTTADDEPQLTILESRLLAVVLTYRDRRRGATSNLRFQGIGSALVLRAAQVPKAATSCNQQSRIPGC